jgi:hypothetical protein
MINPQDWPVRQQEQAVEIVASAHTTTHTIECTEDGVICIQRNKQRDVSKDPEILKQTEGLANYNVLNQEVIEALMSVLATAKAS